MLNHKEDTIDYLGTILFIVLCIFFISELSEKSANQTYGSSQYALVSELHSSPAKAVIVKTIQLPSLQKSCLSLLFNATFNFHNENFKVFADDRRITQSILLLHKTQLKIKPLSVCRFYYPLLSANSEELPFLS